MRGDLTVPSSGGARVLRGCSWLDEVTDDFRCAYRYGHLVPEYRSDYLGFRQPVDFARK